MARVAVRAAGPLIGEHRGYYPLSQVSPRSGVATWPARRPATGGGLKFRSTGTSHLLAISGLHVGVLVVVFLAGSAWLFGRRGNYFLIVPFVVG